MGKHEDDAEETPKEPFLSGRTYDFLRFLALVLLPALGTLYFALAGIWDLPAATQVIGTITAVDTFLGVVLNITRNNYNKSDARFDGHIDVADGEQKTVYGLVLKSDPESLKDKKEVRFKVNPSSE